jgi:hypothetical protein
MTTGVPLRRGARQRRRTRLAPSRSPNDTARLRGPAERNRGGCLARRSGSFARRATIALMGWSVDEIPDLTGRVAVVTGANGGLGFETVRALAGRGAHVVMAVRDPGRGSAARDLIQGEVLSASLELLLLDVATFASVRDSAAGLLSRHPRIDILLHNAGVMGIPYRESVDGIELQLATSHLGHFALTALLMPALLRSDRGRVVSVTSTGRFLGRPIDPDDIPMRRRYDREPGRDVSLDLAKDGAQFLGVEGVVPHQVRPRDLHAAADVDADGVRHDRPIGEQDASDRHAVAGVGVGHQRDVVDRKRQVRQVRRLPQR